MVTRDSVEGLCARARGLLNRGRHVEALDLLKQARCTNPDAPLPHGLMAVALGRLKKNREGLEQVRQGLAKSPDDEWLYRVESGLLADLGRFRESLASAQCAVRLAPTDREALRTLGEAECEAGHLVEAGKTAQQLLKLDPEWESSHHLLGLVALRQKQFSVAEEHFRKTLSLNHASPENHNNLALALQGQGRKKEALEHFNEAVRLDPPDGVLQSNLSFSVGQFISGGPLALAGGFVVCFFILQWGYRSSRLVHHDLWKTITAVIFAAYCAFVVALMRRRSSLLDSTLITHYRIDRMKATKAILRKAVGPVAVGVGVFSFLWSYLLTESRGNYYVNEIGWGILFVGVLYILVRTATIRRNP